MENPVPFNEIRWTPGSLELILAGVDEVPRIISVAFEGEEFIRATKPLPLTEVGVVGEGRSWSARRYIDSVVGNRSTYQWHEISDGGQTLTIASADPISGLTVVTRLTASLDGAAIRMDATVTNDGSRSVDVSWITSGALSGLLGPGAAESSKLWSADNDWLAEYRWDSRPVRRLLPYLNRRAHQHDPRGAYSRSSSGAWSTDGSLPLGLLTDSETSLTVGWQIEHNGAWHWQLGERGEDLYLSALGPTEADHDWGVRLEPGASFTTVPVTLVLSKDGFEGAMATMTAVRRSIRRPHADLTKLPVIFNDYMNTLMGDPTTAKLRPLIDAAAAAGAEIFCIDAGWYDDADGWWDSVGAWEPSERRFPGGIGPVLQHIRDQGMAPGLWLEPEVIGVHSPMATRLPDEAFFQRGGKRVVEHGRFQLDLRHEAARKHLDEVVDRLVDDLGVAYFKLDYNINPGTGTDVDSFSAGAGLLQHNRAYLSWIEGVLDRHPELTIENCASGGMRVDYAMLSRLQLQSTSDQQDPLLYAPIAAAAATAVTPEQAANWAYPQPSYTEDLNAFTLNTGLLGRLQLSGRIDAMDPSQLLLVKEAVRAYKDVRQHIRHALPRWPLGLPTWDADWIAYSLQHENTTLLTVWRRGGQDQTRTLPIPGLTPESRIERVFPHRGDAEVVLDSGASALAVTLPRAPQAITVRVVATGP
jgi:alpha-galactosidase